MTRIKTRTRTRIRIRTRRTLKNRRSTGKRGVPKPRRGGNELAKLKRKRREKSKRCSWQKMTLAVPAEIRKLDHRRTTRDSGL